MRVLINALGATMGGGLRHLTNFLPALASASDSHSYEVLMRSSISVPCESRRIRLTRWDDERAASSLHRGLADLVSTGMRARRYDVLVSLMNFGPILCPIPHVIFQRNALYYSREYRATLHSRARFELMLRRRWTIESMRFASVVVTPTDSMATLIQEDCPGLRRCRFQTLYHGFDSGSFGHEHPVAAPFEVIGRPVLLYSAHLGRYKNFEVLLRSLPHLKPFYPEIRLVLTFGPADHRNDFEYYRKLVRDLHVEQNVVFAGRVGQQEMARFYRAADIFLFPSLCESFGFPLLEAMGFGIPIVASDIPSNRELCGAAASYFGVHDDRACADRIRQVLEDKCVARSLISQGEVVLRQFDWSWKRYAREFASIIEQAAISKAA
jgi:glycosyltransferase involved in cell wall biosynthesis